MDVFFCLQSDGPGGGGLYAAIYGMCFSSLVLLCPKEFNVWSHERNDKEASKLVARHFNLLNPF